MSMNYTRSLEKLLLSTKERRFGKAGLNKMKEKKAKQKDGQQRKGKMKEENKSQEDKSEEKKGRK